MPGDGLEVVQVATDEFHLAMPEDHPFAGDGPLPSGMLAGLPIMLLEDGHCLRDQAIDVCASVGAMTAGTIQGTSLHHAVPDGLGGCRRHPAPGERGEVEARRGSGLVTRPLRDPRPARNVVLAWRASSPLASLYRGFAEAIGSAVQEQCPLDG